MTWQYARSECTAIGETIVDGLVVGDPKSLTLAITRAYKLINDLIIVRDKMRENETSNHE